MYISEMSVGSQVEIIILNLRADYDLTTTIVSTSTVKQTDNYILCDPIYIDGKTVYFKGISISVIITNATDARRYEYQISKAGLVKNDTALALFSEDNIEPSDNRRYERYDYDEDVTLQFLQSKKAINAIGRDISYSGISCIVPKAIGRVDPGYQMNVILKGSVSIKVKTHIVRVDMNYKPGYILVAATFDEPATVKSLVNKVIEEWR